MARTDLEVGDAFFIDVRGKQQFDRIVADNTPVGELDQGDPIVEDFKRRLLAFSFEHMAQNEDRLPLSLRPEIL